MISSLGRVIAQRTVGKLLDFHLGLVQAGGAKMGQGLAAFVKRQAGFQGLFAGFKSRHHAFQLGKSLFVGKLLNRDGIGSCFRHKDSWASDEAGG